MKAARKNSLGSGKRRVMSRRARRGGSILLIMVLLSLAVGQRQGCLSRAGGSDHQRYHEKTFTVVKIVDGDTLDLDVTDGARQHTRVRLWGVDTPETKHPQGGVAYYGPEASALARELALGEKVTVSLEPFERTRGKYGRLLAYVYLPDGTMLNEELIRQGCGYADERFRHMLRRRFLDLQKQARRQGVGLWKDVRPDQWPLWYRKRHDPDYQD